MVNLLFLAGTYAGPQLTWSQLGWANGISRPASSPYGRCSSNTLRAPRKRAREGVALQKSLSEKDFKEEDESVLPRSLKEGSDLSISRIVLSQLKHKSMVSVLALKLSFDSGLGSAIK